MLCLLVGGAHDGAWCVAAEDAADLVIPEREKVSGIAQCDPKEEIMHSVVSHRYVRQSWRGGDRLFHVFSPVDQSPAETFEKLLSRYMGDLRRSAADVSFKAYQARCGSWADACFGPGAAVDLPTRHRRFLEGAIRLAQAGGVTAAAVHRLVDYVFGWFAGEVPQEIGGTILTLALLCRAAGVDLGSAAEAELQRVWTNIERVRAQHELKMRDPDHGSPLPGGAAFGVVPPTFEDQTECGRVTWHSSEADGGPDVGIMLGLGGGCALFAGEISRRLWEDGGPEVAALGDDGGWWLTLWGPGPHAPGECVAKFVDAEAARGFVDRLSAAISARGGVATSGASSGAKLAEDCENGVAGSNLPCGCSEHGPCPAHAGGR